MAGFDNQPPGRTRTESANIDDTLSDVSISRDTSELVKRGGLHPKEAYETYKRLQSDYDELLTKYAQAENTIDQLRIGAKLNLYSDLPPPQKSSFVTVSGGKQPHLFNFPRPNQANLSGPSNVVTDHSNGTPNGSYFSRTTESDKNESDLLTPEITAEGIRTSLRFKIPTLQENVEELQSHVADGRWGESELRELQDVCSQLTRQHGQMKRELMQAKQLERSKASSDGNVSLDEDFLHEDDLEGQLYRLGLRLDEINEQIDQNLHQFTGDDDSDSTITSRNPVLPKEHDKKDHRDPELNDLMKRLRDVKDSAKHDDTLSRSVNSLEDVEDLEYTAGNGIQSRDKEDDFTLGPLNDDSDDDNDKKLDSHNGGIDLQESGYYASETMSVSIGNDNSDPISNHYLSNSASGLQHPLNERGHDTSFGQQSVTSTPRRERPLSDTSVESSPNSRRTRRTSQRSRSSTVENPTSNPMTYYPEYHASSPTEPSPPQASSSILTDETRHQPPADRRESRMSNSSGVRPRADSRPSKDSAETRHTKPRTSGSQVDILRTVHDNPDQYRDRMKSRDDDLSPRSLSIPAESLESSPRQDIKAASQRKPGRQRTSLSSADSRVSTPLFHPGTRPKDTRRRDKTRPPTAETERGFDSGFFGSEGSRTSRFTRTPEVPPTENKLRHPSVREHTVTESEGERFRVPATNSRDRRRRRSYLQSLSESDEDRGLESSPNIRSSTSQRERRGHRHTPTFPTTRSDNERTRRFDGSLRRHSSSPNLIEQVDRSQRLDPLRGSRSQVRPDPLRRSMVNLEQSPRIGPRSDHDTRPMDKQSMRSYPGMDRESVRSGRRSRRDEDSTSGYSDNGGRKHKRDRVDKLQDELQHMRSQLQDEASARNLQSEMYGDLRRKHDDLEREIARKNAEQQMKTMYEDLQKKYQDLSKGVGNPAQPRDTGTQVDLSDDLKRCLENLTLQVNDLKSRGLGDANHGHVRFLCPFCGGCDGHHHGSYYYPGYSGTGGTAGGTPSTPPIIHSMGTQTHFDDSRVPQHTRYPSTPQATSTPYNTGYHSAPVNHYHTNTYPGGVSTASPVHHIHHLPADGRSRDHNEDDYSSDEDDRYRSRRRGTSYRGSRRRGREMYPEDELDSRRLHLSLDEANRAARRMQRLSKKMLNSVATDLIRSGHR